MTFYLAFTGHRPTKIGGYDPNNPTRQRIKTKLENTILARFSVHRDLVIVSGGALGVDQDVMEIAIKLGIPFVLVEPCMYMDSKWPVESQKHFKELKSKAMRIITPVKPYDGPKCLQDRNEVMVDMCDELCAVWDGSSGGTANCIAYAKKKLKPMSLISP